MTQFGRLDRIEDYTVLRNARRLILPVAGASSFHILYGSAVDSCRNWADPAKNATPVGAPSENAGYLGLTGGSAYLELGIDEPVAGSYLFSGSVATDPDVALTIGIGNYSGSAGLGGASLFAGKNSGVDCWTAAAYYYNGSAYAFVTARINADVTIPACLIMDFDATGVRLYNMTTGESASAAPLGGYNRAPSANDLRIGYGYASSYTGQSRPTVAETLPFVMSPSQRADAYAHAKAVTAALGRTV